MKPSERIDQIADEILRESGIKEPWLGSAEEFGRYEQIKERAYLRAVVRYLDEQHEAGNRTTSELYAAGLRAGRSEETDP